MPVVVSNDNLHHAFDCPRCICFSNGLEQLSPLQPWFCQAEDGSGRVLQASASYLLHMTVCAEECIERQALISHEQHGRRLQSNFNLHRPHRLIQNPPQVVNFKENKGGTPPLSALKLADQTCTGSGLKNLVECTTPLMQIHCYRYMQHAMV